MDYMNILLGLLFAYFLVHGVVIFSLRRSKRVAPGPFPLPIIGNLHLLGDKPHISLAQLAKKHGPIMNIMVEAGKPNLVDYFPFLEKIDPQDEVDVAKLPYLRCIVKETLRIHPQAPFLIPREAEEDVELCGYIIPKDSQVFVNVWAIGHDSSLWEDPLDFKPERFWESDIDVRGRDFQLISFDAGRRLCPGLPLAIRMAPVTLGSILNTFNWKLYGGNIAPKDLDMEEKFGLTLAKAQPLLAIPVPL
ncbi:hypothetical protein MTR67_040401 [Solanum verrucosum]|uniref:Cytochrome P450 n=1 Tax=Solanum verrucosum TaxID=315347 RepID=A0AAF0UK40_SOLVR|nr:hypothetical protein MTR67_040401 [Solanum verrucosum]